MIGHVLLSVGTVVISWMKYFQWHSFNNTPQGSHYALRM